MKVFFLIIGLIFAGGLAYLYVPQLAQNIQNDVTENVTAALIPNDLPSDVQIKVDGRDVALTGTVSTQEEKESFSKMALEVDGVRSVADNILVQESLPEAPLEINMDSEPVISNPFGEIADQDYLDFDPLDEEPLFDFGDEALEQEPEPELVTMAQADVDTSVVDADEAEEVVEQTQASNSEEKLITNDVTLVEQPSEPLDTIVPTPAEAEVSLDQDVTEKQSEITKVEEIEPSEEKQKTAQEKTSQECQADISSLIAGKTVNFETGISKIEKDSLSLLDSIAKTMAGCSDVALHIHGYTDNVGDAEVNRKLSHSRAKSVGLYLLKQGVTQRVKIFGHGADDPIADNETEAGRIANRRIEFKVSDLETSISTDNPKTVKTLNTLESINTKKIIAE